MTRKGLAFGAGLSLVASGFVALPAQASGIDNGWVRLAPSAGTTYNTLLGQKFDLAAGFATAADNGAKLKFLVEDADQLARYDIDGNAITDFDTIAADTGTGDVTALRQVQGSTDTVVAAFAAASEIEVGDVVDGDSIAVTGGTAAVLTELNGKLRVSAVKEVASGAMTSAVYTAGAAVGDLDTVVITKNAHGIVAGDIVLIASAGLSALTTDTAATVAGQLNGYALVTAADTNTFTIQKVLAGLTVNQTSNNFTAGTVEVHNVTVNLAGTTDITANSAVLTDSIAGGFDELTDGDALDSAANMVIASFGLAGQSGVGAQKTDGTAGRNADGSFIVDTNDTDDAGTEQTLRLAATKAGSVKVTSWIDSDNDNVIDTTEYRSPQRTVTFVALASATFTTTIDTPLTGSSAQAAYVTIAPDINLAQFASGDVVVDFGKNGASTDADQAAAYDSTLKVLKATASEATGAGDILYAEAQYGTTNYGGKVYATADTTTVNIGGASNANADGDGVSTPYVLAGANYNGTNLRSGTTAVQVITDLTTMVAGATAPAAPAGVKAEITITKVSLASTSSVTAGGKTLASTGTSISYFTTSNADGEVLVDLVATGAATDSVTVGVRVLDSSIAGTAGYTTAKSVTLTWAAATLAASGELIELATYGDADDNGTHDAQRSVAKGGSMTLNYQVRDSFGAPFTAAGYRLAITSTAGSGGGSVAGFAAVTNGLATFTFTDNTVGTTGSYTINANLEKINTAGTAYAEVDAGSDLDIVVNVGTAAAATITAPTDFASTDTAKALETKAVVGGIDGRKTNYDFPYTSANGYRINGVVRSSTGAGLPGQAVTISAPAGVGLATDDESANEVLATGSITVYTNSSGAYSVYAFSNKSGNQSFTITSGSASKTHVWQWAAPAVTAGTVLALDMPASVAPGSTFKVTATLTDKFGNAVDTSSDQISLTYSGPGIVFGTLPVDTDKNGQVSFAVLLGANDKGTVSVTAAYDQSNDNDFTGTTALDKDITVTKTTTVGAVASTGKVNVGSFNGKLVVYAAGLNGARISWKVGGNWGSQVASSNYSIFNRPTPRAGATVSVDIYVNGVKTLTKSVVTR
ncbi:unannotated protein [freshwater metagenome]|uniref:Unannotated protein n=1 Tax=freshwater metagenome TaxID=449393 RepID=A0A6J6E4X6_9ZZZZ